MLDDSDSILPTTLAWLKFGAVRLSTCLTANLRLASRSHELKAR